MSFVCSLVGWLDGLESVCEESWFKPDVRVHACYTLFDGKRNIVKINTISEPITPLLVIVAGYFTHKIIQNSNYFYVICVAKILRSTLVQELQVLWKSAVFQTVPFSSVAYPGTCYILQNFLCLIRFFF